MNVDFVCILDEIRRRSGHVIVVTSGIRTIAWNEIKKGKPDSSHLYGMGADLSAITNLEKFNIVKHGLALGVRRFYVYPVHVHLDIDPTKIQDRLGVGSYA